MQRESFQNKCLVPKTKALSSTPPNGRFLTSQDFFSLCVFINISIFWRMWSFLDSGHIPLHMEAMNNTITMSKQKLSSPSNPIKIMKLTMKRAKEAVRPIAPIVCLQLWEARPGLHKSLSLWYIMTEVQADWDCGPLTLSTSFWNLSTCNLWGSRRSGSCLAFLLFSFSSWST